MMPVSVGPKPNLVEKRSNVCFSTPGGRHHKS